MDFAEQLRKRNSYCIQKAPPYRLPGREGFIFHYSKNCSEQLYRSDRKP